MRRHLVTELPSREVNRYLRNGGDVMLVPVGSVEELGPHLPVGGRCFAAEAFARLMAEESEGLYLPVTAYGPAGETFDRPGSIEVADSQLNEYIRKVMDDLHAQGFRRIVLVTFHHYARYYLPQEFFEDFGCAAAGIHVGELAWGRKQCAVDDLVLGAMKVLRMDGLVARCLAENDRLLGEGGDFGISSAGRKMTTNRVWASSKAAAGKYPLPPREDLSPEKGEELLRSAAGELSEALKGLRAYNEYLARRGDRGFERGSWFRGLDEEE